MKNRVCLLAALLLALFCLTVSAAAEDLVIDGVTFKAVPDRRYHIINPDGLVLNHSNHNGRLTVSINRSETDWDIALTAGCDLSSGSLSSRFQIDPPGEGYSWFRAVFGNEDLKEMLDWFNYEEAREGACSNAIELGRYDRVNSLFMPCSDRENGAGIYVLIEWYTSNPDESTGGVGGYPSDEPEREYLYVYNNSDETPLRAGISLVEASRIVPASGGDILLAEKEAGRVDYTLKPLTSSQKISTKIKAPDGASKCVDIRSGYKYKPDDTNTYYIVNITLNPDEACTETLPLKWMDDKGQPILYETLSVSAAESDIRLTPTYADGLEPVPEGSIRVINNAGTIIAPSIDNGHIHFSYNTSGEPAQSVADYMVSYRITPPQQPQDAVYMRFNQSGGSCIYGQDDDFYSDQENMIICCGDSLSFDAGTPVELGGSIPYLSYSLTEENGATLTWLVSASMPGRFDGDIFTIFWYDRAYTDDEWFSMLESEDGEIPAPIAKQYLCVTADSFVTILREEVLDDEADVRVSKVPVVVVSDETEAELTLVIKLYPQSGVNAQHYELLLEDSRGLPYEPAGDAVLYLPYPEGGSAEDEREYLLRHYHEDGSFTYETLEKTALGLRTQVNSFSPFVLSWSEEAAQQAAGLPATGDSGRLSLYLAAALGALTLLAARHMRRAARRE